MKKSVPWKRHFSMLQTANQFFAVLRRFLCYKGEMSGDGDTNVFRGQRAARGECTGCGKPHAVDRMGVVERTGHCDNCCAKLREYQNARWEKRRQDGLCWKCGVEPAPLGSSCIKCALTNDAKKNEDESYEERLREQRLQAGLCPTCGKSPMPTGNRCPRCLLLKQGEKDTSYEDLVAGDVVTAFMKHPRFMGKLALGKSPTEPLKELRG